ncbi:hypothetical protein O4J55_05685 [Paracoccus sp. PXZ]|uniref:hypothetical protein n=1 Tax=Paracoccus sp. MKU1 TaxID=1745182 RepID=UPI0007191153|nr:hypothetical protein [Paracoccus sp. MKU1]KRW95607.1 hypothetical protein AQY21_13615 [Paracoccus sp. MKU1]
MRILASLLFGALAAGPALAQDAAMTAPPAAPFVQVSTLVPLPDFIPGLGTLYVDPASLPAGPFLGYDHDGTLSATIYMVPIEDLQAGTAFDDLPVGSQTVTSVDVYYNAGHPGVEKPHAHVVLYHDAGAHDRLAK